MAYKIIDSDFYPVAGKYCIEVIVDSANEINNLPKDCSPGSIAIVADKDGKVYMLNASGVWKEL